MELSLPTFLWLRELGCMETSHAIPGHQKGLMSITPQGMHALQGGRSIVRLLHHYCCHRFETPDSLLPQDGDGTAAKRHNWAVISKILKDALDFDLSWERRELIISGDVVEIVVLLKQIHELVKPHRQLDKQWKEKHKAIHEDRHIKSIAERLARPADAPPLRHPADHPKPWLHNARTSPSPTKRRGASPSKGAVPLPKINPPRRPFL